MDRKRNDHPEKVGARSEHEKDKARLTRKGTDENPPHTTSGKMTSPKFGSAGSGGAEFEPGPEKD